MHKIVGLKHGNQKFERSLKVCRKLKKWSWRNEDEEMKK